MDACLATFALRGNYRMLTSDQGFRAPEADGLKLELLTLEQA